MTTISALLLTDPDSEERKQLEPRIISLLTWRCEACRESLPSTWPELCKTHAPIARAMIHPEYRMFVDGKVLALERARQTIEETKTLSTRIENGRSYINRDDISEEKRKQGRLLLDQLQSQWPEQFENIEAVIRAEQQLLKQLEFWKTRLEAIDDGAAFLRETDQAIEGERLSYRRSAAESQAKKAKAS